MNKNPISFSQSIEARCLVCKHLFCIAEGESAPLQCDECRGERGGLGWAGGSARRVPSSAPVGGVVVVVDEGDDAELSASALTETGRDGKAVGGASSSSSKKKGGRAKKEKRARRSIFAGS